MDINKTFQILFDNSKLKLFFLLLLFTDFATTGCGKIENFDAINLENIDRALDSLESGSTLSKVYVLNKFLDISNNDLHEVKKNKRLVPTMLKNLNHEDKIVKMFSASMLAKLGETNDELLKFYEKSIKSEDYWVRIQVCSGIKKNEDLLKKSDNIITQALSDSRMVVVVDAVRCLHEYKDIEKLQIIDLLFLLSKNADNIIGFQSSILKALGNSSKTHAKYVLEKIDLVKPMNDESEILYFLKVKKEVIDKLLKK